MTNDAHEIDASRRHLLGVAVAVAAGQLGCFTPAAARSNPSREQRAAGMNAMLGTLKQVRADVLEIGYVEQGPGDGPVVILLHGWPYDVHSFAEVAPLLVASGYRVIVPFLRGYGTTRFVSADAFRNGQPS